MTTPESGEGQTKQQTPMSPEAQRIAIAEACGWHYDTSHSGYNLLCAPHDEKGTGTVCGPDFPKEEAFKVLCRCNDTGRMLPDYLNDLNACHEMEKVLTEQKWGMYCVWLMNQGPVSSHWECAHATAAQRAEAFLKTLGLWREP